MKIIAFVRSAVFWVYFVVCMLVAGCFLFATMPFTNQEQRYRIISSWCHAMIHSMSVICGVKYSFENMDSIGNMGPVVLLAKHQSGWETMALMGFAPRKLSFVYKKELNKIPVFGWGLASLGMFSIDRQQGKAAFEQLKEKAPDFFAKGWALILFPEGTRTAPGKTVKYKSGGARIAMETGVPVVPVALNSGHCWPKGSFTIYPGTIRVVFGPEIRPEGYTVAELNDQVHNWIETEMRVISPKDYPSSVQ